MGKIESGGAVSGDDELEMIDFVFELRGRAVDLDYADRLWRELNARLDWLAGEPLAGVHPLAGVSRGDSELYLTRRARLVLRLPKGRCKEARSLCGSRLDLGGEVEIGSASERPLGPAKVLYSSFVTVGEADEQRFLAACQERLADAGLASHPAGQVVCGKARRAAGESGELRGFSLMLHGLGGDDSLRLQRVGLGDERKRGCGIFVPHKSLAAVVD
jgi:CRISPR-associated protein Cas6